MERSELTYDPHTDLWMDAEGTPHIRNRFRADAEVFVRMDAEQWSGMYSGWMRKTKWDRPTLGKTLIAVIQDATQDALKKKSPHLMDQTNALLNHMETARKAGVKTDDHLLQTAQGNVDLWPHLTSHTRSLWRNILRGRIDLRDPRVSPSCLYGIEKAKSRHNTLTLRSVLEWSPTEGALTTAELEVLRQALPETIDDLPDAQALAVLLLRCFLATLRRTQQIAQIKLDGHKIVQPTLNAPEQHFLVVPKVKGQAQEDAQWEAIPTTLGRMIRSYQERLRVRFVQETTGHLFVLPPKGGQKPKEGTHYAFHSTQVGNLVSGWVKKVNLISPRTGKLMVVNMNRLRHTGATQMARQGQSRQLIQDMLQHDGPSSASAYIDAVASDLAPVFERVDRQLGGVFTELQNAFFKGKIVDTPIKPTAPVVIPDPGNLAIVGSCGKSGPCALNPLLSCYSGCPHFLAFRDADHKKAYDHVEQTYRHWQGAEHSPDRSKSIKDFERVLKGVREVLDLVEGRKT